MNVCRELRRTEECVEMIQENQNDVNVNAGFERDQRMIENENNENLEQEFLTNNKATQTDMTCHELDDLISKLKITEDTVENLTKQNESLTKKIGVLLFDKDSFVNDDNKTKFFTGLNSYKILFIIHETLEPHLSQGTSVLTTFQQLILTLMKLRLNASFRDLSYRLLRIFSFLLHHRINIDFVPFY